MNIFCIYMLFAVCSFDFAKFIVANIDKDRIRETLRLADIQFIVLLHGV